MPELTQIDPEAFFKKIQELSGLTSEDFLMLDLPDHAIWFPWGELDSKRPSVLKLSEPLPMAPGFAIFSLFQSETEIRAYAIWASKEAPPSNIKSPLRRYCFSKTAPTFFCGNMLPDLFVQAIANEWLELADALVTADEARQEQLEEFQAYILNLTAELDLDDGTSSTAAQGELLQRIAEDLGSGAWQEEEEEEPEPTPAPDGTALGSAADPATPNEAPKPN